MKIGVAFAVTAAVGFAAVATRRQGSAALEGIVRLAAETTAWAGAAPLALAVAHERERTDRRDGIEALALARGFRRDALHGVRTLAAVAEALLVVGVPLEGIALAILAVSRGAPSFAAALGFMVALAAFAVCVAVTVALTATLCGRAFGARGRTALVLVVFVPWLAAKTTGDATWSIPGALDALLRASLHLASGRLS